MTLGLNVTLRPTEKIAIEKLRNKSYDIILMDLQIPEMNGFKTTEFIRNELNSDIPIYRLNC